MKFLMTISLAGIFSILSFQSVSAKDLPSVETYRIKGSGESIKQETIQNKEEPAAPSIPQSKVSSPPISDSTPVVYHEIPAPSIQETLAKPEGPFVSHEVFDHILRKYITKNGWVNYRELKRDKEAVMNLQAYISDLLKINPSTLEDSRDRLAAWLNLYNAIVLSEILGHYPVNNVLKIQQLYSKKIYQIGDSIYSLMDIEETIFRNELQDSRTVFSRVNGSSSGPKFLQGAFEARKVDQQLEAQVKEFFNVENVKIDQKNKVIRLNATFLWYEKDFLNLPAYVSSYLNFPLDKYRWEYLGYDWKLNDEKLH